MNKTLKEIVTEQINELEKVVYDLNKEGNYEDANFYGFALHTLKESLFRYQVQKMSDPTDKV